MEEVTVDMPEELWEEVRRAAAEQLLSPDEWVAQLIRNVLTESCPGESPAP